MTHPEARRAFSIIIDIARSRNALMDHTTSPESVGIWGATEGELHLTNVGSDAYPDYELDWEGNTMMHAVAAGEPAQESSRISMADMTVAAMFEIIFAEPVQARLRREAVTEHWNLILSEGAGLFFVGPKDDKLLRAFVRTEHNVHGQLFAKALSEPDDYRVVWSQSLKARTNIPEDEQIDLTDMSVVNAVATILAERRRPS